jgi:glycosyltransferase involved in cell wall biosynthesis
VKILWTISNWKRTGPVEPSLDLAAAVAAAGHEVLVAVGRGPRGTRDDAAAARGRRSLVAPDVRLWLHKHAFLLRDVPDVRALREWIRRERPEVLVTTLPNDHRLVARAAEGTHVPVVRLWFGDPDAPPRPREVEPLRRAARVFAFGGTAAQRLSEAGVRPGSVALLDPPLDVDALRAEVREPTVRRAAWGAGDDPFCFGIVARLQRHRRFELLWEAAARLREAGDVAFRVVVVGRGTWQEEVGLAPVRRLGLGDRVVFTGYLRGVDYASTVAAFHAQLLLVPGSDPTCRALREGMALGVPSLAFRRGLLPMIVEHGVTGRLVDETAEALAAAMAALAHDPLGARRMGAGAAGAADARFRADRVAERFLDALA